MPKRKTESSSDSSSEYESDEELNKTILDQFKLLLSQIKFDIDTSQNDTERTQNSFRLKAINDALKSLTKYNKVIKSGNQVKDLPKVGKGTIQRIDEILKTGKLLEITLQSQDVEFDKYIDELTEIYGIGRKTAVNLYKTHGVKNASDLKKLYDKGKIELNANIVKGIKYADKIKQNIPRKEIDNIHEYLNQKAKEIDKKLNITICGSYRRLQQTSNDVDVLLSHPKVKTKSAMNKSQYMLEYIELLIEDGFIIESFTDIHVKSKYMGLCKYENNPIRRLDIRFIPYESYSAAILYFTGPKDFNTKMRNVAISYGYTLNEYGLYDENDKMFKVESEKDIFDLLDMEYLKPENRA